MNFDVGEASIIKYLKDAIIGKITLPVFQRDYVWSEEQVRNFALSFLKGEYVGNIILARINKNIKEIDTRLLPFVYHYKKMLGKVEGLNHDERLLLIDGQQRLATLAFLFYNDYLMINVKRGKRKKDDTLFVFGKYFGRYIENSGVLENVYKDLKLMNTKVPRYLWMAKYEEVKDHWEVSDVYALTFKDMEKMLNEHENFNDFIKELILNESSKQENKNKAIAFPLFTLGYKFHEYIERIDFDIINLRKLLEELYEKRKLDAFKSFAEYLADEFKIPEKGITYAKISEIKDIEELAELYEKLNTTLVKLGYFDILRAAFSKIKYVDGKPMDISKIIDNITEENSGIKVLSHCVNDPKDYFIRGFNLFVEMKNSEKIELGLRRATKQKQKSINVYDNLKKYYSSYEAEEFEKDLKEYAKRLDKFVKNFDRLTYILSFCSERNKKLSGGVYIYGAAAINPTKEGERALEIEEIEFFARLYLRFLLLEGEYFRNPDNIFLGVATDEIVRIPRSPSGDEEYMRRILPERILKSYSNDNLLNKIWEIKSYFDNNEKCDDIHLFFEEKDFEVLLLTQGLVSYKKGLKNIKTLEGLSIRNLADNSIEGKLTFKDVDIHHIFPKSRSNDDKRRNLLNLALLSKDNNKRFKNKEPKDYWGSLPKEYLLYNLIPAGEWYCNYNQLPKASLKHPPENECEFWRERAELFTNALEWIFGLRPCQY